MKIILIQNETDTDMIELWDEHNKELYAVFHSDLVYREPIGSLLKEKSIVKCTLTLSEEAL